MPRTNKRRFIDPRKSVTFEVVPRNQVDPLAADELAPKNVLVEKKSRRVVESEYQARELSSEKRLEEQRKYGVYFDDDYNYLQHLRDVRVVGEMEKVIRVNKHGDQVEVGREMDEDAELNQPSVSEEPRIVLPSSVFPSHVEERVGHLHKGLSSTGFRPDWDPDVIAALDDNFEGNDDELEDDFVALASGGRQFIEDLGAGDEELTARRFYYTEQGTGGGAFKNIGGCAVDDDDEDEMFGASDDGEDYDERRQIDTLGGESKFSKEETRSRFTSYSMSSSVMTRTGGLKTLDDQFEQVFEHEYDEKDVGALDGEDIEGCVPIESDVLNKLSKQYEEAVRLTSGGIETAIGEPNDAVKTHVMRSLERSEDVEVVDLVDNDTAPDDQRWDCESILSTRSNLYNRPKVIEVANTKSSRIRLGTSGMPVSEEGGLTKRTLRQLDGDFVKADDYAKSVCDRASAVNISRMKDESPEERKARKQHVKDFRRERRIEKKANALAFKAEECRQKEQETNVRNNLQGIKLL